SCESRAGRSGGDAGGGKNCAGFTRVGAMLTCATRSLGSRRYDAAATERLQMTKLEHCPFPKCDWLPHPSPMHRLNAPQELNRFLDASVQIARKGEALPYKSQRRNLVRELVHDRAVHKLQFYFRYHRLDYFHNRADSRVHGHNIINLSIKQILLDNERNS